MNRMMNTCGSFISIASMQIPIITRIHSLSSWVEMIPPRHKNPTAPIFPTHLWASPPPILSIELVRNWETKQGWIHDKVNMFLCDWITRFGCLAYRMISDTWFNNVTNFSFSFSLIRSSFNKKTIWINKMIRSCRKRNQ